LTCPHCKGDLSVLSAKQLKAIKKAEGALLKLTAILNRA
jgi:uncharacterized protein YbaR (Trm112 family)